MKLNYSHYTKIDFFVKSQKLLLFNHFGYKK